jgi:hypothetical protein
MCVGWDWQDWVIAILLPVDVLLLLLFLVAIVYAFIKKKN